MQVPGAPAAFTKRRDASDSTLLCDAMLVYEPMWWSTSISTSTTCSNLNYSVPASTLCKSTSIADLISREVSNTPPPCTSSILKNKKNNVQITSTGRMIFLMIFASSLVSSSGPTHWETIFGRNLMDAVRFRNIEIGETEIFAYLLSGIRVVHEQPVVELKTVTCCVLNLLMIQLFSCTCHLRLCTAQYPNQKLFSREPTWKTASFRGWYHQPTASFQ